MISNCYKRSVSDHAKLRTKLIHKTIGFQVRRQTGQSWQFKGLYRVRVCLDSVLDQRVDPLYWNPICFYSQQCILIFPEQT